MVSGLSIWVSLFEPSGGSGRTHSALKSEKPLEQKTLEKIREIIGFPKEGGYLTRRT
jgi:hypothetical protein